MPAPPPDSWDTYLGPDEHIVWTGAPQPDPRLRPAHVMLALFGLPFLIVGAWLFGASAWSLVTLQADGLAGVSIALFLMVFALPFLGAGLAVVLGPHLANRLAHRRVRYALSTRRAFIATRWWGHRMKSFPIKPDALVEIERDRLDTVRLHIRTEQDSDGDMRQISAEFCGMSDGMALYQLIRKLQSELPG